MSGLSLTNRRVWYAARYVENMITYCKVGWYHPSNANWSYSVWLIVDATGAKLYRETFGGDYRMREKIQAQGVEIEEVHGVQSFGQWKAREVTKMSDIETYTGVNFSGGYGNLPEKISDDGSIAVEGGQEA